MFQAAQLKSYYAHLQKLRQKKHTKNIEQNDGMYWFVWQFQKRAARKVMAKDESGAILREVKCGL